jgi:hypothetical protein
MTSLTYAVKPVCDLVADYGSNPCVIQGSVTYRVFSEPGGTRRYCETKQFT